MIELRSDTFTLPTPRMRKAMAAAAVGNDVYGEDPTVRALEDKAAALLGKDAACLMPSGTMANLVAILAHVPRAAKLICGTESDIYQHEAGGASVCGGASYAPVPTQADGKLPIEDISASFPADPGDPEFAPVALICLENSHNRCGGRVLPTAYVRQVHQLARSRQVPLHMDGARIFNAAAALDLPAARLAQDADSVQFCLSKGLCAPIGSMLTGATPFIQRARRIRKMLGGGMRQAGIIAAAGIVALDHMRERLAEDHANAQRLAAGLAGLNGVVIDPATVETNIVMFRLGVPGLTVRQFIAAARDQGVAVGELGHGRIRAVTHANVSKAMIDQAITIVSGIVRAARTQSAAVAGANGTPR